MCKKEMHLVAVVSSNKFHGSEYLSCEIYTALSVQQKLLPLKSFIDF
jgi:hypothetical protein